MASRIRKGKGAGLLILRGYVCRCYRPSLRAAAWICAAGLGVGAQAGLSTRATPPTPQHALLASETSSPAPLSVHILDVDPIALPDTDLASALMTTGPLGLPVGNPPHRGTGESAKDKAPIVELPPPPDSATTALSGLLTIGTYGLVRSARSRWLAAVPGWYQANGPRQVGRAVAIELGEQVLHACWPALAAVPVEPESDFKTYAFVLGARCELQDFVPLTAPRGPPLAGPALS